MLEITTIYYSSEEDDWAEGCMGPGRDGSYVCHITAQTKGALLKEVSEHLGIPLDSIEVDACEEPGRIDASRHENAEGAEASPAELDAWKRGECALYYATYTMYVEDVTRKPANLSD